MNIIEMVSLLISLLNYFGPTDLINEFVFPLPDPDEEANYTNTEHLFEKNYVNTNPMMNNLDLQEY